MNIEELAHRIDEFARDHDPYEYADNEWSYDKTLATIVNDPIGVLTWLSQVLEDLMNDYEPNEEELDEVCHLRSEVSKLIGVSGMTDMELAQLLTTYIDSVDPYDEDNTVLNNYESVTRRRDYLIECLNYDIAVFESECYGDDLRNMAKKIRDELKKETKKMTWLDVINKLREMPLTLLEQEASVNDGENEYSPQEIITLVNDNDGGNHLSLYFCDDEPEEEPETDRYELTIARYVRVNVSATSLEEATSIGESLAQGNTSEGCWFVNDLMARCGDDSLENVSDSCYAADDELTRDKALAIAGIKG